MLIGRISDNTRKNDRSLKPETKMDKIVQYWGVDFLTHNSVAAGEKVTVNNHLDYLLNSSDKNIRRIIDKF